MSVLLLQICKMESNQFFGFFIVSWAVSFLDNGYTQWNAIKSLFKLQLIWNLKSPVVQHQRNMEKWWM